MLQPKPGSYSDEVEKFLKTTAAGAFSQDVRASAPWFDRRLRALEHERGAIVTALRETPVGPRTLASALLRRIRKLVLADTQVAFDCYWQDVGGEA